MTFNSIHKPTNAIKNHRIHSWSSSGDDGIDKRIAKLDVEVLERTSMVPVTYKNRVPCFIIVGTRRPMNKQGTSDAVRVLERVMTVVPGSAVLGRLEFVGESVVGSYGTLRNTVDPIICICMKLTYAMPVDSSSVVWMVVGNMNCLGEYQVSFLPKPEWATRPVFRKANFGYITDDATICLIGQDLLNL